MVHELKTWIEYFQFMVSGEKSFELRKNDRDFRAGQELMLKEYDKESEKYTSRILHCKITYVLKGEQAESFGLKEGFCIMGLEKL